MGGAEGFFGPIVEGVLLFAFSKVIATFLPLIINLRIVPGIEIYISNFLLLFAIIIFAENIVTGLLGNWPLVFGYCIGVVFSILLYVKILFNQIPEMNHDATGIIIVIILAIIVRIFLSYKKNSKKRVNLDSNW
jgi:hypothetical protein